MPTLTTSQKTAIKKSKKPAKDLATKYSVHLSTIYKVKKDGQSVISATPAKKSVAKKSTRVNA